MARQQRRSAQAAIPHVERLRELVSLGYVRVHMAQGRAAHASAVSLDATGRLMLATDTNGSLLWCTPRAEEAIERVVPGWTKKQVELPLKLRIPMERLLARGTAGATARAEQEPPEGM